ncbi:superoxide dismutase [Clostridium botulinum]|uniref:superoxide dismutase n=3 Tax=Clostridium botulinum TaxID=1491 RepID=A5HZ65_CLOBH|nr:superoxide dismutase [Clostridium botulinum]EPS47682.1 Fe/Mn family superoxide dismutase [Clostridium botulinum CFSAN002367]EPS49316.1 Fe/Mn family superoxide dismutase [Clostridium botulinum CFSAN002369]ABS35740.1 superoxide dismutase, Mn/Fe family [Clostridium botulinum A str. ATCC 19397]ABS38285.1 superoxide dismutase, Mn/Fe family [Clostridium botulinum A str. Hall]ACO84494.1 superoxide dismutase, Mn/Fe family [Clostridium botulinum A2 str. Kyoto]
MIVAKKYPFDNVKGISLKQLTEHYKLYDGYVNMINKIWSIPNNSKDFKDSNATFSKLRCIKLGESYALDGVKLHELYFQNMTSGHIPINGPILDKILEDFNSVENFTELFKETGKSMRGWVVLGIDPLDKKLHIFGSDSHDNGAIWLAYPLLVMDVYEHAYFMDFGTDKGKYMDAFLQNVNWNLINNRLGMYYTLINALKHNILLNNKMKHRNMFY